ncbi:MAG: transcriptional repressor [Herpetosiphonaceae bacterium]|nr:transcriptional repressor [Herpetosiphonaceae bacterium]
MAQHHPDYATLMRARGFRMTPQRQLILEALGAGGDHLTLEEIYARVQHIAPTLNLATVYRTLDFLCDQRLVATADVGGQKTYELVGEEPHHHLVCRSCGEMRQIDHAALHALCATLDREQNFTMDMEHLVIFGRCSSCRGTAESVASASDTHVLH